MAVTWKVPQFVSFVGAEEAEAAATCIRSGWITEGPLCERFVEQVKAIAGVKYGVLAPNGTLALYLALKAIGVAPGEEVIVPDLTFIATATAALMAGAKPVFVDVNEFGQVSASAVATACHGRDLVCMPVHLYGSAAALPLASRCVEDACQALGVELNGRKCGSLGLASAFSFFADKTITTGEGGFVGTNDEGVYQRLRYLRNQGRIERGSFVHPEVGQNFRMTDIQAAVGLAQLTKMPQIVVAKRAIYRMYSERLEDVVRLLKPLPGSTHIPFRTVAFFNAKASDAATFLSSHGVEPRSAFYPLHRQPCFAGILGADPRHTDDLFPHANYFWEHALCLPAFASMAEEQVDLVCETVKAFVQEAE